MPVSVPSISTEPVAEPQEVGFEKEAIEITGTGLTVTLIASDVAEQPLFVLVTK